MKDSDDDDAGDDFNNEKAVDNIYVCKKAFLPTLY